MSAALAPRDVALDAALGAVGRLAPALGLTPGGIDLRLDREGTRLLADAGARGAARGNVVWLAGYDPASQASRLTLAHELVHVAQGRLPQRRAPSPLAAEREADLLATALLAGSAPDRPRVATGGALHFDGPEPAAPAKPRSLEELVRANYAAEREDMARLLAAETPSADAVTRVLDMLAPLPFETARVLAGQLAAPPPGGPDAPAALAPLAALANGIREDHVRSHRREVLAAAENFTAAMMARGDNGHRIFHEMRLDTASLTPAEHRAAVAALRTVPVDQLLRLEGGDNGPDLRVLRSTALPEYDREEARGRAARTERSRRGASLDLSRREEILHRSLAILLTDAGRDDAREALRRLAEETELAVPDPRFSGAPAPATSAANSTGDDAMPPLPPAVLQSVIARLDAEGAVERWIGALEPADRSGDTPEARGFAMLVRARRPDRTMARMRELLTRSFLDWAVRDWEAWLAWDMLRAMPPAEQARFQSLDEGRLYLRLIEELPDEVRASAAMAGLIVVRGEDGAITDLTAEAGALLAGQTALLHDALSFDGSTEAAYRLFVRLVRLATPAPVRAPAEGSHGAQADAPAPPASGPAVLRAVVHRLDVLGVMRRLFAALSDGVKQDRRYWPDIALVLCARDPAFNREDLRRLLNVTTFLWVITIDDVSFEEALFAFHILRALPEDQRRAFELEDRGAYASRIAAALSQPMLQEAGLAFAFTRPDERGETPLRRQMADPAAWDGANPADLALMVQMGIAAGDFDWVFEQSRRQRAWTRAPLGPLVERFALYDPRVGRTFPHPHTVSAARPRRSYLAMLFGTGAYELEEFTRPATRADPFTGEATTYAETTGMRVTVDLEQLQDNAATPLYTGAVLSRTPGARLSIGMENREAARRQPNVVDIEINEPAGFMRVRADRINLASFASVSTASTLRAGAVSLSDLDFEITFAPEDLRSPRAGRFHVDDVSVDEIVRTTPGEAEPTGLAHLGIDSVDASASFQTAPLPDSPVLGHVLGLLWDLVLNRDALTDTAASRTALGVATVSVGRIDAVGLRRGDLRIASLSIQGFSAAAAGNRAAHLRAQIFVLDARIERARTAAPDAVAGLIAEREALRPRLAALEPLETEMLQLMARLQAGHRLDAAQQARLDTLQAETGVGGAGGLSVDIARVSVDGVDGPVRLAHAELNNIHGGGESGALAFRQLTSEAAIRRFVSAGAPPRSRFGAGIADAGMSFTADDFTLTDLALPATIPTLDEIDTRLRARPTPPIAERAHLNRLRPLVQRYEALRARSLDTSVPEGLARSPQDQRDLIDVSRQLGDILDIRVARVDVTRPIVSLGENEGLASAGAIAGRIRAEGIRAAGYSIDAVDALHPFAGLVLKADSLGDVTSGQASEELFARVSATELSITGIHGPGITETSGQSLTLSGIGAYLRMDRDGLHIEGLSVRQLDIAALDYNNGTHHIWAGNPSTARQITADILIRLREDGAAGFAGLDYRHIRINSFRIGRVEGDGLGYEKLAGGSSSYRVEIASGALLGLELRDFDLDMRGADTHMAGRIDVAGFDQMRFRFAMGQMLEANGQLDRAVTETPGVTVDMASDGRMTVGLDTLVATDTEVAYHGADGRSGGGMHITRGDLSGQVVMQGNDTRLQGLRLETLEFSRINWRTASGVTIRADGPTTATGVRFTGRYSTLANGRSEFAVDSLHVDRISAARIVVDAGPLHLELPEPIPGGSPRTGTPATLTDIDISNLLVGMGGEATTIGPAPGAARAHGSIGGARTDFLFRYGQQLQASGMLQAGRIDFWFDPDGAIEGRATGVSSAGTIRYGNGNGTGIGATLGYGLHNVDSGLVRYAGNVLSFGAGGSAPLRIERLNLSQLELTGPSLQILAPNTSEITASDVTARLSVHFHPTPAAAAAARTPFERIVVDELRVGGVSASGMRIHLASLDLWLDLPVDEPFTVGPILVGRPVDPASGEPFEIALTAAGPSFTGQVRAEALRADRLQAQLVGALNARMNFAADALVADLAGDGPMSIDLLNWSATEIAGYVMGDPAHRIGLRRGSGGTRHDLGTEAAGLGGERLTYNGTDGGHLFLHGTRARGVRYDDAASGIHLDMRDLDLPYQHVPLGANARGERRIVIPEATISDAWFAVDDLAALAGLDRPSGGGAPTPPSRYFAGASTAYEVAARRDFLRDLNGAISGTIRYALGETYFLDAIARVNIPITGGRIPLQATVESVIGQNASIVNGATEFRFRGNVLEFAVDFWTPPFAIQGVPIPPMHVESPLARWELQRDEIAQARAGNVEIARLARTVNPRFDPAAPATPPGSFAQTEETLRPARFSNLDIGLSLDNAQASTLDLGSTGWIRFAPNGVQGLSFAGSIAPLDALAGGIRGERQRQLQSTARPGSARLGLDSVDIEAVNLMFSTATRNIGLSEGEIHVDALRDASLAFTGIRPRRLEGMLTSATVRNLVVSIAPNGGKDESKPGPNADRAGVYRELDRTGRLLEDRR